MANIEELKEFLNLNGHGLVEIEYQENSINPALDYDYHEYQYDVTEETKEILKDFKLSLNYILNPCFYFFDWDNHSLEESWSITSLLRQCCKEITRDENFLKKALVSMPNNLYDVLMKEAVCNDFRDSAAILMSKWPSKAISTYVVDSMKFLYPCRLKADSKDVLALRLMLLWRLFFDGIRNNSLLHLRILDLRGVPMSDSMVYFLLCQITNLSNETIQLDKDYYIIMDCAVHSSSTFIKLTLLLNMVNLCKKYNPHLIISSIDVFELDETQCWALLQAIDPKYLIGLNVSATFSIEFYTYIFTKFSSLKNLEVSAVNLQVLEKLPFQLIPNLRRLGYAFPFANLLSLIPNTTLSKLEYLGITSELESLIEDDLRYLTLLPLVLSDVILNGRVIKEEHLNLWRDFLRSITPTLKILRLYGCLNDENLFPSFVSFILPLSNLRFLGLGKNVVSIPMWSKYLPDLRSMPKLKKIRLYHCE